MNLVLLHVYYYGIQAVLSYFYNTNEFVSQQCKKSQAFWKLSRASIYLSSVDCLETRTLYVRTRFKTSLKDPVHVIMGSQISPWKRGTETLLL